jgi:hypothetical protein
MRRYASRRKVPCEKAVGPCSDRLTRKRRMGAEGLWRLLALPFLPAGAAGPARNHITGRPRSSRLCPLAASARAFKLARSKPKLRAADLTIQVVSDSDGLNPIKQYVFCAPVYIDILMAMAIHPRACQASYNNLNNLFPAFKNTQARRGRGG